MKLYTPVRTRQEEVEQRKTFSFSIQSRVGGGAPQQNTGDAGQYESHSCTRANPPLLDHQSHG